jgi:cardiolipin synthase
MWLDYLVSLISIYLVVAVVAGIHVLLYKRDSRAAFGWLGLIIVFPIAGAILYALFGVNRVQRKARRVSLNFSPEGGQRHRPERPLNGIQKGLPGLYVTGIEAAPGNEVTTFYKGEEAFPAMLEAIGAAEKEVLLSSYIFDNDDTGLQFIDKLAGAQNRGCKVRVLVDDVGIRYSLPTIIRQLKQKALPFRRFMPLRLLPPSFSINLRTHRKLLITDRRVTFAGGMNIGERQLLDGSSPHRASDLHFRFKGPVTANCVSLFADDWKFAGGDDLEQWDQPCPSHGRARCRLVSDGPDDTLDSLILVIMGAISSAHQRIWIMTPYFLPNRQMLGCLQAAALSGVDVKVMIPEENNWAIVQWALQHNMAELLDTGVQVFQRPAPFAHSKCLVIDDDYALVGSSNLDPRSLRLNFELGIEVFDPEFNLELSAHFEQVIAHCTAFTIEKLKARGTLARLRDGISALFSPYL